jgi:protein-tyrosine kinase
MGKIFDAMEKIKTESRMSSSEKLGDGMKSKPQIINRDDEAVKNKVSRIYNRPDRSLVSLLAPRSFEAEQFKVLRTNILFPGTGKPPRVIMVTSAVPSEGKSFVASNLAASIAQNIDNHVLLMDCDLRLPTIHKVFGITQNRGLSEYLSEDMKLSSLFVKTGINKLSILPGGNPPANPAELISSDRMAMLINEVKNRYDDRYIILDSAPPLLASESNALVKYTDGILLVINYGSADRKVINELADMLGKDKILGIVFNRFDVRSSTYYGYGKYDKYNKYYK